MIVKGSVERVVFRNNDNGYSVLIISDSVISITAVGIIPPVSEGEVVELEGDMIINPKYRDHPFQNVRSWKSLHKSDF